MEIFSQMIGACIFKIIAKFIVHSIALYMNKDIDLMYGIFQKQNEYFYMISYNSIFWSQILGINSLVIIKPMYLCYRCYK